MIESSLMGMKIMTDASIHVDILATYSNKSK